MLLEGLEGQWADRTDHGGHDVAVRADLVLGVPVQPQAEEVEEVVEVDLPVHLGVEAERQVDACQLARDAVLEQGLVVLVGAVLVGSQRADHPLGRCRLHRPLASLAVARALGAHLDGARQVELVAHHRVASADFVEPGGTVADPLTRHEDRHLHVEGEDHLLERAGVAVAQQVVDEGSILAHGLGALPVRYPRRLDDARVPSEVVDEPHEAVVENGEGLVQQGVRIGDRDPRHARHHTHGADSSSGAACQSGLPNPHESNMSVRIHNVDFRYSGRKNALS